jgi:hypothetical protein
MKFGFGTRLFCPITMPKDKSENKEKKGKKVKDVPVADDVEMADADEPQVCIHQNF